MVSKVSTSSAATSSNPYPVTNKPPFSWEALQFIKPLAIWYSYMRLSDRQDLPVRVQNALDSCCELMGVRLL